MNHDFWHPVETRVAVACDTVGHTPHASHNSVDLLSPTENWQWVSEIIHGPRTLNTALDRPRIRRASAERNVPLLWGRPAPVGVTRCPRLLRPAFYAQPPYDQWERTLSQESRCYGCHKHVLVTGPALATRDSGQRINSTNPQSARPESHWSSTKTATLLKAVRVLTRATPASCPWAPTTHLLRDYSTYESPDGESCVYLSSVAIEG